MLKVRVWDIPTRFFQWGLVFCFVGLILMDPVGGAAKVCHSPISYSVVLLILFELACRLWGGHWARFSACVVGPLKFWRYVRGRTEWHAPAGHTPLYSESVVALLDFPLSQCVAGLFSGDELAASRTLPSIAYSRPLGCRAAQQSPPPKLANRS